MKELIIKIGRTPQYKDMNHTGTYPIDYFFYGVNRQEDGLEQAVLVSKRYPDRATCLREALTTPVPSGTVCRFDGYSLNNVNRKASFLYTTRIYGSFLVIDYKNVKGGTCSHAVSNPPTANDAREISFMISEAENQIANYINKIEALKQFARDHDLFLPE